jgi:hypothetical protein
LFRLKKGNQEREKNRQEKPLKKQHYLKHHHPKENNKVLKSMFKVGIYSPMFKKIRMPAEKNSPIWQKI